MKMQWLIVFLGACVLAATLMSVSVPADPSAGIDRCVNKFRQDSREFYKCTVQLRTAIEGIDSADERTVSVAREALKEARMQYKSIEFFLEYFFPTAAVTYNMPPKYEIEEPNIEFKEPVGLQVIESLLYEKDVYAQKKDLLLHMEVIESSAEDINSLLFNFKANDKQLLESLRLELIRIMSLGIAGFDSPLLKSGIRESYRALTSVQFALEPFLSEGSSEADSVGYYLLSSLRFLQDHSDFDSFDRLQFYTDHALPLQKHLARLIREGGWELNTVPSLNYEAADLFRPDFLVRSAFSLSDQEGSPGITQLGEFLFFEKKLSGNQIKSCATCHNPSLYFTDGLSKSEAFDEHTFLPRNAPSVLYSVFQYFQRWDGSKESLEDQIVSVLESPDEMNIHPDTLMGFLQNDPFYRKLFEQAFGREAERSVSMDNTAFAIAEFIRQCNPFNSPFDRYMQGDRSALTAQQKKGFNLFMGKAQCGTCHFIPLFNGLTPPLYDLSEVEIIGVPGTASMDKPVYDSDRGRYNVYPIRFYDGAFKTPGLRNIARTAPYMHNGVLETLEEVMDFYNKGGGRGIGLDLPEQTLPSESLNLTEEEMKNIISFLNALTDSLPVISRMPAINS